MKLKRLFMILNDNGYRRSTVDNIVLAIVGLTVLNSSVVLGICTNVGQTLFKCPTIANT
jgi:hypothetical protein